MLLLTQIPGGVGSHWTIGSTLLIGTVSGSVDAQLAPLCSALSLINDASQDWVIEREAAGHLTFPTDTERLTDITELARAISRHRTEDQTALICSWIMIVVCEQPEHMLLYLMRSDKPPIAMKFSLLLLQSVLTWGSTSDRYRLRVEVRRLRFLLNSSLVSEHYRMWEDDIGQILNAHRTHWPRRETIDS